MPRTSLTLLGAACLGIGCASSPAQIVKPTPPPAPSPRGPVLSTCYNLEYSFTCVPPRGFLITAEAPGPGKIMTLVKRSHTTSEEANLSLHVQPLRHGKLKPLIDRIILQPLQNASGVQNLQTQNAQLGQRDGLEINLDRQ